MYGPVAWAYDVGIKKDLAYAADGLDIVFSVRPGTALVDHKFGMGILPWQAPTPVYQSPAGSSSSTASRCCSKPA
jgi:hypothetical protein